MLRHLRALAALCFLACPCAAFRQQQVRAHVQTRGEVDFSFMTSDFSYAGNAREKIEDFDDFKDKLTELTLKRPNTGDVLEEIVKGHACADKNANTMIKQTYYASSFCYWLPEINVPKDSYTREKSSSLRWTGGAFGATGFKDLTDGSALGQGKCVRMAACHDNAANEDAAVSRTSFLEEVTLSKSCLTEYVIQKRCDDEYIKAAEELSAEYGRCAEVKTRFDDVSAELSTQQDAVNDLSDKVNNQLPQQIRDGKADIVELEKNVKLAEERQEAVRQQLEIDCQKCTERKMQVRVVSARTGQPLVGVTVKIFATLNDETPLNEGVTDRTGVTFPWNMAGKYIVASMDKFVDETREYDQMSRCLEGEKVCITQLALSPERSLMQLEQREDPEPSTTTTTTTDICKPCDDGKNLLRGATGNVTIAEQALTRKERSVQGLERQLEKETKNLALESRKLGQVMSRKGEVQREWDPQAESCGKTFEQYGEGLSTHKQTCIPNYYDASCEKECTQLNMKEHGCGVVEGFSPDFGFAVGGIELVCKPPQPSWIKTIDGVVESEQEQCKRITASQTPQYAQKILKKGWLLKRGRNYQWDRRFFILESGDKVRSALLHYFEGDPAVNSTFADWMKIDRGQKSVILWDAEKKSKAKDEKDYSFTDGTKCFKIYHFYRDYRLCVEGSSENPGQHRDEWVKLINEALTFPAVHESPSWTNFFR